MLELCLDILDAIAARSLHDVCFISNRLRAYSTEVYVDIIYTTSHSILLFFVE